MTQQTASIDARLQERISEQPELAVSLLQQVLPPASAIVVGVNRLNPVWLAWPKLGHDNVLLIDAQGDRLQAVHQHLHQTRGWRTIEAVLDADDATAPFHSMSHAGESGLLPDTALQQLWPNIRSLQATERPTQRLDTLLANESGVGVLGDETASWLVVDCLPALRILRGAEQHVQRCNLVAARVLVGAAAEAGIEDATLAEVDAVLAPAGFRHAFSLEETHPDIITAIFVRDVNAGGGKATEEKEAQIAALVAEKAELIESRDAEAKAKADAIAERDAAVQARDEAIAQRDAAAEAKASAISERDSLQEQLADLQPHVDALSEQLKDLTHAWEMEIKAKADAIAARDAERLATTEAMKAREHALAQLQAKEAELSAIAKEKAELLAARDEAVKARETEAEQLRSALKTAEESLQQLTLERDEARQELADQSERMQQLEAENAEAHRRHQLMQDEMVKAEAQIELIKDLLLREQGL